jgi:CubicO group peptidase (beta-lactamase class C family)
MKVKLPGALARLIILGLLLLGAGLRPAYAASHSGSSTHAAIDAYMKERMQARKIPGAALAVVQGDRIEYLQGYGVA